MFSVNIHYRLLKSANCFTRYLYCSICAPNKVSCTIIGFLREWNSKKTIPDKNANRELDVAHYKNYQTHEKLPCASFLIAPSDSCTCKKPWAFAPNIFTSFKTPSIATTCISLFLNNNRLYSST